MSSVDVCHDRVTLFASGGDGRGDLATSQAWAADISRNPVFYEYGAVDVLVLALRGDAGHPASVAEDWAARLGAQFEVFESLRRRPAAYAAIKERCWAVLST